MEPGSKVLHSTLNALNRAPLTLLYLLKPSLIPWTGESMAVHTRTFRLARVLRTVALVPGWLKATRKHGIVRARSGFYVAGR